MDDTQVLFIIAFNGFQHIEYGITKHIIEQAGFISTTASDKPGTALATDSSSTHVDIVLEKVSVNRYAGVIFVGGPGAIDHLDNSISYKIIQDAHHHNIPVGAICVATRILAKAGILDGKYATGWNGDGLLDALYKEYHVQYLPNEEVVIDDNIITATGPSAAQKFGELFVHMLQRKQSWG